MRLVMMSFESCDNTMCSFIKKGLYFDISMNKYKSNVIVVVTCKQTTNQNGGA